jgi:hypothetical protein
MENIILIKTGIKKACFGTKEYSSWFCKTCEYYTECALVNPKRFRLKLRKRGAHETKRKTKYYVPVGLC